MSNRHRFAAAAIALALLLVAGCRSTQQQEQAAREAAAAQYRPLATDTTAPGAQSLLEDLRHLTETPHRLAGFEDGSLRASHYVEARLRAMGVEEIVVQTFPVVQPVTTEAVLIVDGEEIQAETGRAIYPMRPNVLLASVTPAEGLSGQTVYAGDGHIRNYGREFPEDRIVLLDFDSVDHWQDAFAFGARAVVFIGQPQPASRAAHHVNVPANLPRFYIPEEVAERLDLRNRHRSVHMTIKAAVEWHELRGRNVIGVIRGTNPRINPDRPAQAMVLAAPLDSLSEVPELSPGARDAANAAALLQTAQRLMADRPQRDTVVCFFDGQTQANLGARAFYGALNRGRSGNNSTSLPDRISQLQEEQEFTQALLDIVQLPDPFDPATSSLPQQAEELETQIAELRRQGDSPEIASRIASLQAEVESLRIRQDALVSNHRDLVHYLRREAESLAGNVLGTLSPLRVQERELKRERAIIEARIDRLQAVSSPDDEQRTDLADARRRMAEIDVILPDLEQTVAALTDRDLAWNELQRDLNNHNLRPEQAEWFKQLGHSIVEIAARRMNELDLLLQEAFQGRALQQMVGLTRNEFTLHLSLNLGDARLRWGIIHGCDSERIGAANDDKAGHYSGIFRAINEVVSENPGLLPAFEPRTLREEYNIRLFAPSRFVSSGAAARMFTVYNLSLMTIMDRMPRQGQPTDTLENLNVEVFSEQMDQAIALLRQLGDKDTLHITRQWSQVAWFNDATWMRGRSYGPTVNTAGAGSAMANRPVRDAVVAVAHRGAATNMWTTAMEHAPPGFVYQVVVHANTNGNFEIPPHSIRFMNRPSYFAVSFDQEPIDESDPLSGTTTRGIIDRVVSEGTMGQPTNTRIAVTVFKTNYHTVVGYGFNHRGTRTMLMRAASNAEFLRDRNLTCEYRDIVTLFAPDDARAFKLFNRSNIVLLNNPDLEEYLGEGISLADPFSRVVTTLETAHDLQNLNQARLNMLRRNSIMQETLEVLQGVGRDLRDDARQRLATLAEASDEEVAAAPPGRSLDKVAGLFAASSAYSHGVYPPLIAVMNDLVTAVVLLLLLAMPFAYALERLLIGTPHIYRQIGWFAVFFLLTFGVLYVVNPAFRIAATPIIIFLAFAIILLSSLVIFIMIRKLQTEIKKMQGLATSVHSADVSRLSTVMAAVNMGISTMRRRPLRTALTAATVVLLTFTILTFASFGSEWGVRRTYQGPMTESSPRIMVRHQLWSIIHRGTYDRLRGSLAGEADVVPLLWVAPTAAEAMEGPRAGHNIELLLAVDDALHRAYDDEGNMQYLPIVSAAVGLDYRDVADGRQDTLRALLRGRVEMLQTDGIFLTTAQSNQLGLSDDDVGRKQVLLAGVPLTYAGTIRDGMSNYSMLEGSSFLPVDYLASGGEGDDTFTRAEAAQTSDSVMESARFVPFNLDSVVVIPGHVAHQLGGRIRAVSIYPLGGDPDAIQDLARDVAHISDLPTYVGDRRGVSRLLFMSLTKASGWRDLLVPVLLGGFIVFATMLGSVSDREREIYTFSSLGLAPPHIASLFFAEASMYAVVGGMGGYLLGQGVTRVVGFLSDLGYISVPRMNYSSTNAIVTILLVMCTVLISTIYPAMKASRSANPGVQRQWKIPRPKGDTYDIMFPFTVSAYDIVGVVSFLKEHFDNFTDAALGVFASIDSHVFRQSDDDKMLGFNAEVALAPFDLGVTQQFTLISQPSDIEGIDEVRIVLVRLSGSQNDWQRANRVFINDLRKQLLIWRSLTPEIMEEYRQKTLEAWDRLPVEDVPAMDESQQAQVPVAPSVGGQA